MHTPTADEKLTPVMVYTRNALIHAEVLTKESVRVSIWLRTDGAPRYMHLLRARVLILGGGAPKTYTYPELLVPSEECLAFHLVSWGQEALDYDPEEKNRVNAPYEFLLGGFYLKGKVRLSSHSTLISSLEVLKTPWMSLYDVNITNPSLPQFAITIPMGLVRPNKLMYGLNEA